MNGEDEAKLVLVTGEGGFTGGALVRELVVRGNRVRGMVRPGSDRDGLTRVRGEVVEGNVRSLDDVKIATQGVRVVCQGWCSGRPYIYGPGTCAC